MPDQDNYADKVKRIELSHGAGGQMSRDLITQLVLKHFAHPILGRLEDSAVLEVPAGRLAFTTDSYVVQPLFFPGGDIGKLAVAGTVNDLLCAGARPVALSLGLIVEEGFSTADLDRILESAAREASRASVEILCGDTKVVERGKADGLFINTSGIGIVPAGLVFSPQQIQVGDVILLSGTLGDHGMAILSRREGIQLASSLDSDCAALVDLVRGISDPSLQVHCLRDPTRGGLGAIVAEIAADRRVGIRVDEEHIPVKDQVRGACELLGLDVLYVANEGKMVLFVAPQQAEQVLSILREDPHGRQAACIGQVVDEHPGMAVLQTRAGGSRIIDLPTGELLPRIC